ncbi:MAG: DUF3343 domain-containing protein [Ruminococcus sp.]|nr:DUF3343 domain-containing protein [Ruminococcus sp.]
MKNNLIMFSSVTHAIKSRDLLKKYGIDARMIRTPIHLRNKSCGYSLLITKDFEKSLEIIKKNNIGILGVSAVDFR